MRRDGIRERRSSGVTSSAALDPVAQAIAQILTFGPASWQRFDSAYVTTSGGTISAAADVSPNGRSYSQGTSTRQPAFANPGATFDGSDDTLSAGSAYLDGAGSMSVFALVDLPGVALSNADMIFGNDTSACTLNFGGGAGGFPRFTLRPGGGTFIVPIGPNDRSGSSARVMFDMRLFNGACRLWDNGVAGTDDNTAWSGATIPCGAPNIGAGTAAGGSPFPGTVFDVLVFSPGLSLADQATVRTLLAASRGLSL